MDWMDSYALKHKGNNRSNVNGYQSPDDFWQDPSFDKYLSYMEDRIDAMVESYKEHDLVHYNNVYRISNMWFNINYNGCYNAQHTHPGCPLEFSGLISQITLANLLFTIMMLMV